MNFDDLFPRKYLKASDLNGKDLTLTIRKLESKEFDDGAKPFLWFKEHPKAYILNRTTFLTIAELWGDESDDWIGKPITLFECEVSSGGDMLTGIRVRSKAPDTTPISEDNINF